MKNLFKAVLFISPLIFLIFWYVVSSQHSNDVEMKKSDAQFEQKWNEFDRDFTHDAAQKKIYQERSNAAANDIEKAKIEEEKAKKKSEKFSEQLDKAVEDKEVQKKLERELNK